MSLNQKPHDFHPKPERFFFFPADPTHLSPAHTGHTHLNPAPRRILGLCNNFPYVVMLSAARDLLEPRPVSDHAPLFWV